MSKQRAYNKHMETLNKFGTKAQRRRKYSQIIKEMGAREITLSDVVNGAKELGFLDMMKETGMTMDEAVVLQQYARAIQDKDTRSAEFLRDTVGEKPSTQIEMNDVSENGLSKMSLEELMELRDLLKKEQDSKKE